MNELRLTRAAEADIAEIEEASVEAFGVDLTGAYLAGLAKQLRRILEFPHIGIARDDIRPGTRSIPYQSHRIFYRVEVEAIVVQRVIHKRRLIRSDLFE